MSKSLYIVMALCVGQVPAGGSPYAPIGSVTPYSPSYKPAYQQTTVQPVPCTPPQAQVRNPVRTWLQNNFGSQKNKAGYDCAIQGAVPAVSSYSPVSVLPR